MQQDGLDLSVMDGDHNASVGSTPEKVKLNEKVHLPGHRSVSLCVVDGRKHDESKEGLHDQERNDDRTVAEDGSTQGGGGGSPMQEL